MEREDWALLAIASAKGEALSPVQLQKVLFLLGQSYPEEVGSDYYTFVPYNYGPFDLSIYQDAEHLARRGLITSRRVRSWEEYEATAMGSTTAAVKRQQLPVEVQRYLDGLVTWAKGLSFRELVSAVYKQYPEYRVNSVFKE